MPLLPVSFSPTVTALNLLFIGLGNGLWTLCRMPQCRMSQCRKATVQKGRTVVEWEMCLLFLVHVSQSVTGCDRVIRVKALSHLQTFSSNLFEQSTLWEQTCSQQMFAWEKSVLTKCSWEQNVLMQCLQEMISWLRSKSLDDQLFVW